MTRSRPTVVEPAEDRSWKRGTPPDVLAEAERQWRLHWGPDAVPAMVAVTSIMRVHQILLGGLNDLLARWDLTFARYEALMLLYYSRRGALPLGRIGSRLQVHPTSVTNIIDGLQRLGLVSRERHEFDRRVTLAMITDAGRVAACDATAILNEAGFACSLLSRGELESLATTLRRVRADEGDFVDDERGLRPESDLARRADVAPG